MGRIAVIGGTVGKGMDDFLVNAVDGAKQVNYCSGGVPVSAHVKYRTGRTQKGRGIVYINRHDVPLDGDDEYSRPDAIDWKAYMVALKDLGVTDILATSSVGTASAEVPPKSVVIPSDCADETDTDVSIDPPKSKLYTGMCDPLPLRSALIEARSLLDPSEQGFIFDDGLYITVTRGPTFESAAEIRRIQRVYGEDFLPLLVGMTAIPEIKLARCLDMRYGLVAVTTNWAAGIGGEITDDENKSAFEAIAPTVKKLLTKAIDLIE